MRLTPITAAVSETAAVHTTGVNWVAASTIVAGVAALLGIAGLLWKRFVAPGRELNRRNSDDAVRAAVIAALDARLGPIAAQMRTNGGSSMKDDLDRQLREIGKSMDRQFLQVNSHLAEQDRHLDRLDRRVDGLFRRDGTPGRSDDN